ncbi:MAG: XrtA system polysaccharide deacetylase [Alphaproteobacteria bacterium]
MSVDVEDYFQVSAFAGHIPRADWDAFASRVERNTDAVLGLFDEHGVCATFFTLGWVAERFPSLVRRIVEAGHELASHGYEHVRITEQDPETFREDVRRTKHLLEDVGGVAVRGYRAASFSLGAETLWAHAVLAGEGYAYSSSVYPVRHDLYGMPEAPRFAYRPRNGDGIWEIPITSLRLFKRNFPCGGGGYFRLLPYPLSRWGMRRVNRVDGQPCVFYFHPWEIDPEQPRQRTAPLKSRLRHYTNLDRMAGKLNTLLGNFAWDRIDRIFLAGRHGDLPAEAAGKDEAPPDV